MSDTLLAIITTLIGGVFGFVLSEISTWRREMREEKQRAISVRTIVSLEIERNLDNLRAFWKAVKPGSPGSPEERSPREAGREFVNSTLPPFSREALNSQLPLLALALRPDQIAPVFQFYDALGALQAIRRELSAALDDQNQEVAKFRASQTAPGQTPGLLYAPRTPFDNKVAQVWPEVERLAESALAGGNPLKQAA
ncbi:MAG: hypothetical protein IT323_09845 [Anaerolineae bacterium]|nr:hypothetical protein [Anaerolineae bacterium]